MNDTDARLWHPWLRINRVLCVMPHTRWSAEAWPQFKAERYRRRRAGHGAPGFDLQLTRYDGTHREGRAPSPVGDATLERYGTTALVLSPAAEI